MSESVDVRELFRQKREQRQAELKAKIAAQRKTKNGTSLNQNTDRKLLSTETKPQTNKSKAVQIQPIKQTKPNPPEPPKLQRSKSIKLSAPPPVKTTKAAELRLKKNNPLYGIDFKTFPQPFKYVTTIQPPKPTKKYLEKSRRSISQVHLKRLPKSEASKCIHPSENNRLSSSRSEENLASKDITKSRKVLDEISFCTPRPTSKSVKFQIGSTPRPSELRERLNAWLKKRGKSLNAYNHLRCFGVHQATPYRPAGRALRDNFDFDEEDKENNETLAPPLLASTESIPKVIDYTNLTTNEDIFGTPDLNREANATIVRSVLSDLHALILDGYPQDRCLEWLAALKKKYPRIQEEAQYWECCAAIGEINEEFTEALDCYQQAIIKGAKVSKIECSIEKLFEKFSVLNLNDSPLKKKLDPVQKKKRADVMIDARNIFKSTVIKLAVQERAALKAKQKNVMTPLLATPVRRSSRLSINYSSTPNLGQNFTSIKQIEDSLHRKVDFQQNNALRD